MSNTRKIKQKQRSSGVSEFADKAVYYAGAIAALQDQRSAIERIIASHQSVLEQTVADCQKATGVLLDTRRLLPK